MTRRTDRINGLLRQEISSLLSHGLKDPRITGVVSITQVEISMDLRHARVFVSVLGTTEEKERVLKGANSANGFMRRELRRRLSLRYVPQLTFVLDESMEKADYVFGIMDSLSSEASTHAAVEDRPANTGP
jgi:ribosome-binding factor A